MYYRSAAILVCAILMLTGCSSGNSTKTTKAVKPRFHNTYYKKHVYYKHVRAGRIHLKLFEKQGVKTVKKNWTTSILLSPDQYFFESKFLMVTAG